MSFRLLSLLLLLTSIGGCTLSTKLELPSESVSVIDYTQLLLVQTSKPMDKLVSKLNTKIREDEEYRELTASWCPRHRDAHDAAGIGKQYGLLCSERGGEMDRSGQFCANPLDPLSVYFMASAQAGRGCTNGPTVNVVVVEPKNSTRAHAYLSALRARGYRTELELDVLDYREAKQKEAKAHAEFIQKQAELPHIRKVGAAVCQDQGRFQLVGFVERIAEDKVQIRIVDAHIEGIPSLKAGGFQSTIIWDNPGNWRLCR